MQMLLKCVPTSWNSAAGCVVALTVIAAAAAAGTVVVTVADCRLRFTLWLRLRFDCVRYDGLWSWLWLCLWLWLWRLLNEHHTAHEQNHTDSSTLSPWQEPLHQLQQQSAVV